MSVTRYEVDTRKGRLTYSEETKALKKKALSVAKVNGYKVTIEAETYDEVEFKLTAPDGFLCGASDVHEFVYNDTDDPFEAAPYLWKSLLADAELPPEKCEDADCDVCRGD